MSGKSPPYSHGPRDLVLGAQARVYQDLRAGELALTVALQGPCARAPGRTPSRRPARQPGAWRGASARDQCGRGQRLMAAPISATHGSGAPATPSRDVWAGPPAQGSLEGPSGHRAALCSEPPGWRGRLVAFPRFVSRGHCPRHLGVTPRVIESGPDPRGRRATTAGWSVRASIPGHTLVSLPQARARDSDTRIGRSP